MWVGDATKVNDREYTITNKDFNSVQHAGDSLSFTFLGHGSGDIDPTIQATVDEQGGCSGGGGTLSPGQTRPTTQRPAATDPPSTGVSRVVSCQGL